MSAIDRVCGLAFSAIMLGMVAGCGSYSTTTEIRVDPAPAASEPAKPVAAAPTPTVEILSWDGLQKRREAFHGKVVVIDVWSTYCTPCIREFSNLVALQERFGDKIVCVSFDTDYAGTKNEPPESFKKPVLDFLTSKNAMLLNVISSDPSEEFFDKLKLGGPPAVFVYDQSGQLVKRFDNSQTPKVPEFTYQKDVIPLVTKLLAAK